MSGSTDLPISKVILESNLPVPIRLSFAAAIAVEKEGLFQIPMPPFDPIALLAV